MKKLRCLNMVFTIADLYQLKYELDLLVNSVYTSKEINKELIDQNLTEDNAKAFLQDLTINNISVKDTDMFISFVKEIFKELESYVKVSVTFAVLPSVNMLERVVKEIKGNEKIVIDYKVDCGIYGGVIIMKDGLVYDYSIREAVDKIIKE